MSNADMQNDTLELDEILEKITFYCFDEAKEKINAGDECVPFTVLVDGDQMFVETHPGEDVEKCRTSAEKAVRAASAFASHYAFCYDGFLMTDDGQLDAIIVECATNEMEKSYIIALLYKEQGEDVSYEPQPVYIEDGESMFDLKAVAEARQAAAREREADEELLQHLTGNES